jgi:hypothetical protein
MNYFIQRNKIEDGWSIYTSEKDSYPSLEEAKDAAKVLDIGTQPEALRIVDENNNVCGWVSRNGWVPRGALKSIT